MKYLGFWNLSKTLYFEHTFVFCLQKVIDAALELLSYLALVMFISFAAGFVVRRSVQTSPLFIMLSCGANGSQISLTTH